MSSETIASNASTEHNSAGDAKWIYRHSRIVRLCHWINAVSFLFLTYTGMQMLLDYPELYWGKVGYMGHKPALHLRDLGMTLTYTEYGHHIWHIGSFEFPGDREWGRYNHFFFAWLFSINGLIYLVWNVANRHFWRDLVPGREEFRLRHLSAEVWNHLRLRTPKGEAATRYNTLQKVTYLIVIFVFCTVMTLSGLAQSPGFVSAFPITLDIFGGRQTARSIHVLLMVLMLMFLFVHLFEIVVSGFVNEVRSMITGNYKLPVESPKEVER